MEQRNDALASDEMSCQELVELVTEYLEGTLPVQDRQRFEAHLAGCQGCTNYLAQMRQTMRTTSRLSEDAIPPEAKQALLGLFRNWKRSRASEP